jgi:putative flavoprotein involved in K+ transport
LVVGASASGLQIADELHHAGRPVTIAVGHHTRVPRRYRGRDIMWWLDRCGFLDATEDHVHDVGISREQPSLQLIGHPDHHTLNLQLLHDAGVRVVGRLQSVDGSRLTFADDLVATTAAADVKLAMLLERIDDCARSIPDVPPLADGDRFEPIWPSFTDAPTRLDLDAVGIRTVLWATGFTRAYPWLHVPVLDGRGDIRHRGGITSRPGLYVLGLHFLRRRKSNFIDGVGLDAAELSQHLAGHLRAGRDGRGPKRLHTGGLRALASGSDAPTDSHRRVVRHLGEPSWIA